MSIICPSPNSTISTLATRSHISSWLNLSNFSDYQKALPQPPGDCEYSKQYIEGPIVSKSSGTPGQNSNMQRVSGQMPTHLLCRLSSSWLQKPRLSTVVCVVGFDCWSVYSRAEYSCSYLLAHHLEHTDCHVCILLLLIDGCLHSSPNRCNSSEALAQAVSMYQPGTCKEFIWSLVRPQILKIMILLETWNFFL